MSGIFGFGSMCACLRTLCLMMVVGRSLAWDNDEMDLFDLVEEVNRLVVVEEKLDGREITIVTNDDKK